MFQSYGLDNKIQSVQEPTNVVRPKYGHGKRVPRSSDQKIIEFYLNGNSLPKTGKYFFMSESTVSKILKRNNIKPKRSSKFTKAYIQEMINLYEGGSTSSEVGKIFRTNQAYAARILKRNGAKMRSDGGRPGELHHSWKGGVTNNKSYQTSMNTKYKKEKRANDPLFKLLTNMRTRVGDIMKRRSYKKMLPTIKILGAPLEIVKQHIESQFLPGMTWENHGKGKGFWNYDHIIPLAKAQTEEELLELFHYTNMAPLWFEDNIKKNSFYDGVLWRKKNKEGA